VSALLVDKSRDVLELDDPLAPVAAQEVTAEPELDRATIELRPAGPGMGRLFR
jgi:hypothetical protein